MPAGEVYVPLAADYADNRKVRALMRYGREARQARDLFVQMLCYCKRTMSDGFVPDEQVGLLVYPDPEKIGKRDAGRLAEVGLIERGAHGWFVVGWLERNSSRTAVREKSAAKARGARLANHRRWHRNNPAADCEWCTGEDQNSDQTTDPNSDKSSDQSPVTVLDVNRQRSESTETESYTETESETEVKTLDRPDGRPPASGSDDDPDFAAFWDAYPRKVGKGQARKAWRAAARKAEPKTVIAAAERYRDDPHRRGSAVEFTAHPATWLNGERWADHPERPAVSTQDAWWN